MRLAKRICFLGKNGIGKSVVVSNISQALHNQGYRVLQVGNDISMSSTLLLMQDGDFPAALEELRQNFSLNIRDCVVQSPGGVFCLELGGLNPGAGCMARAINLVDELLETQGIAQQLELDYVLYDISGEIPCTGYVLPIRDGIMEQCVVITTGSFSSLFVANHLITGIIYARRGNKIPIRLLVNYADRPATRMMLESYAQETHTSILGWMDYCQQVEDSVLNNTTVFDYAPESLCNDRFREIAQAVINVGEESPVPCPMDRASLREWAGIWKRRRLDHNCAACASGREYSGNT